MRAASGLDTGDSLGRQDALTDEKFGILAGVNVVRHYCQTHGRPKSLTQDVNQRGLPAADWSRNADSKCTMGVMVAHKLKEEISLRQWQNACRFASEKLAVGANFVGFRIHFDAGRG
jgi:hypothetical protein